MTVVPTHAAESPAPVQLPIASAVIIRGFRTSKNGRFRRVSLVNQLDGFKTHFGLIEPSGT